MIELTKMETRKFWEKIDKTPTCWLWIAGKSAGYGIVSFRAKIYGAHVLSWIIHGGVAPKKSEGLDLCHTCDIKNCVNPAHLYIGTRKQNMQDWSRRRKKVK